MMSRTILFLLAAATLGAAAWSEPSDAFGRRGQERSFDANRDGVVSEQEVVDGFRKLFTRLDRNGDGVVRLSDDRFRRDRGREAAARFVQRMDANDDDAVSWSEVREKAGMFFSWSDGNGDGVLDAGEVEKLRELRDSR